MSKLLIVIIKFYKYFISPLLGNKCRFYPTCSEYSIEALQKYGFIKGVELGFRRILKCHPFKKLGGDHGVDFVPSLKKGNKNG
jgi:putative membrane protein insertion efficiency factor